jgi:phosphohistidine swiveling domain-containing protein
MTIHQRTKAQTLSRLKNMVTLSQIEDQVSFTVDQWNNESSFWINEIQDSLGQDRLIIRSSALTEDGMLNSNAGAYTSILDVQGDKPKAVQEAVETVIKSYPDNNPNNEVLVQPMLTNVQASGVVFTRGLASGAPYYTVNYDDFSGSTESITSGTSLEGKTLVMLRDANDQSKAIPKNLQSLLPALREIEALVGYESLDIEFAITAEHGLHILQVRPIAVQHTLNDISDHDFYILISEAEATFQRQQLASAFVVGNRSIFGVMSDWNPAEIIGVKPSVLATSLYRSLIVDETWATQRSEYGYRDVRPQPLLISFAGHPYIDIRASFNSFVPASLPDALAEKVVDFCLNWLEKHPELHDKVEFDVIPTCFDLNFSRWENRFVEEGGFSSTEIYQIRESQLALTTNALQRNAKDLAVIEQLEKRYQTIKSSCIPSLEKAFILLDDSRRYGTLPFAHLARSAFVAVSLLRSAVAIGVLRDSERDDFLNTIHTVSQDLTSDSVACAEGNLIWDEFVEKYGHLRPGTYDITSPSYRHDAERYLRPSVNRAGHNKKIDKSGVGLLWASAREKFGKSVIEAGLSVTVDEIENFMRTAIEGREYAKFAFTRNLSLALDELVLWGESHGVEAETLSQLSIEDLRLLRSSTVYTSNVSEWVRSRAKENQQGAEVIKMLELPPLLSSADDFSVFLYPITHANYIGSGSVTAACVYLEQNQGTELDLEGKIVLIPQADPGHDWLFGRNIAGLITMYGGANSHMAIRAAEFSLPAAIGIGETHYRNLAGAIELELNASQRVIRVIH